MNSTAILAFVVAPAFVAALGWGAVPWHERRLRREFGPRAAPPSAPEERR